MLDSMLEGYSYVPPILDNFGICIPFEQALSPEYRELRDRLRGMTRLRRWLSFRMRRRLEEMKPEQMRRLINAVLCMETNRAEAR